MKLQRPGTPCASAGRLAIAVGLAFVAASVAPAYASYVESLSERLAGAPTRAAVIAAPPGWTRVPYRGGVPWRPLAKNPSAQDYATFVDAGGQTVDVFIAVYDRQYEGHRVLGYGQGAIEPGDENVWRGRRTRPIRWEAAAIRSTRAARRAT